MRILVCGDRNWSKKEVIRRELEKFPKETTVIHGAARGADTLGGIVARELGFSVEEYPANWEKYGKAAGPIRNRQMLETKPDLVLAFHHDLNKSKGTKHMLKIAKEAGIEVKVVTGRLRVYTSTLKYQGPNKFNISIKSGDKAFAPTWDMVQKMRNGQMTQEEFKEKYYNLMRKSYKENHKRWQSLLEKEEVVLVCYCPVGVFCHRYILVEILEKLGAIYEGEI